MPNTALHLTAYNRSLWPAVILTWLLTAAAIAALYRRGPRASGVVAAILAFHWGQDEKGTF